ncbi:hypothetical protein ABT275_45665 [Streptomyces sp. NPDC001185]|uniref:hypothetical protein n=1 Tax=Streptomyces sp. NPDC001185 TaxID=3154380 RepID=UPI00331899A0
MWPYLGLDNPDYPDIEKAPEPLGPARVFLGHQSGPVGAAARALAELDLVSAHLVTFYASIGDIVWADVGNGYFVDPVPDLLLRLKECGAVCDGTGEEACGLVIGSDGGGLCYAG